jgi:flavodoxin
MSTAILYYSLGGTTKKYSGKLAAETGADAFEVKERTRRNMLTAFIPGCMQAAGGKASKIVDPGVDLGKYDEIIIAGPIWAGNPAPAVNAIIALLPPGKTVTLVTICGSGSYDPKRAAETVEARGCTLKETRSLTAKEALA